MNTENMIEITGCDLVKLAQEAYNLSKPQGMGFLHFEEGGLSDKDAAALITEDRPIGPLRMDYVKGRACKLTVFRDGDKLYIPDSWYDHSQTHLETLLERIKTN